MCVLVELCRMCASVTADLFCDLCHSFLQVVILLGQSSVLLEQRLADSCSQLQIPLFLSDGEERRQIVVMRRCNQCQLKAFALLKTMYQCNFDATNNLYY